MTDMYSKNTFGSQYGCSSQSAWPSTEDKLPNLCSPETTNGKIQAFYSPSSKPMQTNYNLATFFF